MRAAAVGVILSGSSERLVRFGRDEGACWSSWVVWGIMAAEEKLLRKLSFLG